MKKRLWMMGLLTALMCFAVSFACAEEAEELFVPVFALPVEQSSVALRTEIIDDELWLFLPAFAQLDQLSVEGYELEWWDMEPDEEGLWYVDLMQGEEALTVYVMRSQNLRSFFLFSDDPENHGRAYIDGSAKHTRFTTASMALINPDGQVDHAENIEHLRGRGNGTWAYEKKAYQIKLETPVDLLDTGDAANRARTWVLLSEQTDVGLIRGQLVTDMARALGVDAMDNEYVDFYYDGEYRGAYLLSEKVEVDEGRVDILDYDKLLKKWNNKVGQRDLEALPAKEDTNRYGNRFTYVDGVVEDSRPGVGAFFVEMETEYTLTDRCYFTIGGPEYLLYAVKNPENASQNMMRYISERLHQAYTTLRSGGVNPENGHTIEDDFDMEAFARTMLLQEFAFNVDGYNWSSSFFVLPADGSRFEPGPVWDFDLSFRYYRYGDNGNAAGFKDERGWVTEFYRVPSFLSRFQELYFEELTPMIRQLLYGGQEGQTIRSLQERQEYTAAAAAMNFKRWPSHRVNRFYFGLDLNEEFDLLYRFIEERRDWMDQALNDIQPDNAQHIPLWVNVQFTQPHDTLQFYTARWQRIEVEVVRTEQLTEADEENYALWEMEAIVSHRLGQSLAECSVSLNGTPLTVHPQPDGTLRIRAQYEDQSYRPVDYYGEDVGLVFDYEKYIAAYPEVAEECGWDEQAVMDYFFDEGVYEAQVGNGLFDPKVVAQQKPSVYESLGDDWLSYYWEFISWGRDAEWMANNMVRFMPAITDMP